MSKNFLIMTEGVRTEPNILASVLEKYGFNVIRKGPIRLNEEKRPLDLDVTELADDKDNIYIAQGPKNRISEFLLLVNTQSEDIEIFFKIKG